MVLAVSFSMWMAASRFDMVRNHTVRRVRNLLITGTRWLRVCTAERPSLKFGFLTVSLCLPTGTCNSPYMTGIPYKDWCLGFSLHKMRLTKLGHVQQIQASGISAQRNGLLQSRQGALVCGGIQDSTQLLKGTFGKEKRCFALNNFHSQPDSFMC